MIEGATLTTQRVQARHDNQDPTDGPPFVRFPAQAFQRPAANGGMREWRRSETWLDKDLQMIFNHSLNKNDHSTK